MLHNDRGLLKVVSMTLKRGPISKLFSYVGTPLGFPLKKVILESKKRSVLSIKRWFPFNFAKNLQGRYYVVGEPKNFKLLADISFDSDFQKNVLSTTRNFNENWPLYLSFSNMITLCPNIWFIKNWKYQQFLFWKKELQKNISFSFFLKGRYFVMGGPIDMNVGVFWKYMSLSPPLS